MTCYHQIQCPHCGSSKIKKSGKSQRVINGIIAKTLTALHRHLCLIIPIKPTNQESKKIVNMAINTSGFRDTVRVLGINKNTVISTLKKKKKI